MFLDYYSILGVDPAATQTEIKKAYKRQALQWHPDKNPGRDTTEQMQKINEAYMILSDVEARERYNCEYQFFVKQPNPRAEPYNIKDETLKQWINNAREKSKVLAKQALDDVLGMSKAAFLSAFNRVKYVFLVALIIQIVALIIVAVFVHAQEPLPLEPPKSDWSRVHIEGVGSVDLPPTMEIQQGSYKEFMDNELEQRGFKIAHFVAQQKGLNEGAENAFGKYARVMVETDIGKFGDYEKLNFNIHDLTKADIIGLDRIFKQQMQQEFLSNDIGVKLTNWYPLKIEKINSMSCIHINYTRQLNSNPPVLVHMYIFFNHDRMHRLILSYQLSKAVLWETDFVEILNSFRITNIR